MYDKIEQYLRLQEMYTVVYLLVSRLHPALCLLLGLWLMQGSYKADCLYHLRLELYIEPCYPGNRYSQI